MTLGGLCVARYSELPRCQLVAKKRTRTVGTAATHRPVASVVVRACARMACDIVSTVLCCRSIGSTRL
jgi:hypothetical protein